MCRDYIPTILPCNNEDKEIVRAEAKLLENPVGRKARAGSTPAAATIIN